MTSPAPRSLPLSTVTRLAELASITAAGPDIEQALLRAARISHELLPGCAGVSVTVSHQEHEFTFGASTELAEDLDQHQYDNNDGPCVSALRSVTQIASPDLEGESRWPGWTPAARAAGVVSMLSLPLSGSPRVPGVLNLYGADPHAFDGPAVNGVAAALAAHNGVLLANLEAYGVATRLAASLQEAMASRAGIEQAKGILMGMLGTDADTAFAYLARLSQQSHRKLRDVATGIVSEAANGTLSIKDTSAETP